MVELICLPFHNRSKFSSFTLHLLLKELSLQESQKSGFPAERVEKNINGVFNFLKKCLFKYKSCLQIVVLIVIIAEKGCFYNCLCQIILL